MFGNDGAAGELFQAVEMQSGSESFVLAYASVLCDTSKACQVAVVYGEATAALRTMDCSYRCSGPCCDSKTCQCSGASSLDHAVVQEGLRAAVYRSLSAAFPITTPVSLAAAGGGTRDA